LGSRSPLPAYHPQTSWTAQSMELHAAAAAVPLLQGEANGGREVDLGPTCTLQELLAEQLAAAQRVLATSRALSARLDEAPPGQLESAGVISPMGCWDMFYRPTDSGTRSTARKSSPAALPPRGGEGGGGRGVLQDILGRRRAHSQSSDGEENTPPIKRSSVSQIRRQTMFPDREVVKEQVRQVISKQEYNVELLYHKTGFSQALARSNVFKNLTFFVIALNSLWIAVDTDLNKELLLPKAAWEFQVMENLFCAFFTFEIFIRFRAFRHKRDAMHDFWFMFDSILVVMMIWGTWASYAMFLLTNSNDAVSGSLANSSIFRLVRLFRLSRAARLARLLKDVPELMILIKGIAMALRAVFSTLVLLVLTIYIFAIAFTQLLSGTEVGSGCFDTVLEAMNCLLLNGVFADQANLITKMLEAHWTYYVGILIYMVIASLTVLNMLIGVMCEVVSMVSQAETEAMVAQNLKDKISKMLHILDVDNNKGISQDEFRFLLQNPAAMRALTEVNVDALALVEFADFIFQDEGDLTYGDFVDSLLQFRNDKAVMVKDLHDVRRFIANELEFHFEASRQAN